MRTIIKYFGIKDKEENVVAEPQFRCLDYWGNDIYIASGQSEADISNVLVNHKGKVLYNPGNPIHDMLNEKTFIKSSYYDDYWLLDMDGKQLTKKILQRRLP